MEHRLSFNSRSSCVNLKALKKHLYDFFLNPVHFAQLHFAHISVASNLPFLGEDQLPVEM
jgi:hypothetical protein